ncbi:MAG TPA: amino acid racemase [Gemmatimonadales bacterium]|jgi:aspartate racemase|nr:amino acid racemase [Gemmatimonadales bacterium]
MKTLGIIGGIAPESTIDYYRQTIARYRERTGTSGYPSIMINSIDLKRLLELVAVGHLDELTNYLAAELGRLIAAGADFALLAANTPHIVFEQVRARCPIPLLSIVEAACGAARSMGCRRVGLLGTRFTMEAGFYPEVFAAQGIEVIPPQADEREFVHSRYVGELVYGVYREETRHGVLEILGRMRERDRVDAAILGGTELPFLFRDGQTPAVPLLDTTRIHVERAVEYLLSDG